MRTKFIYLIGFMLLGVFSCQQKVDTAAEETAIREVIQKELNTAKDLDHEGVAAFWVHEPYVMDAKIKGEGMGWKSVNAWNKKICEALKKEPGKNVVKKLIAANYDIHLNGNIAFVIYDEYLEGTFGGKEHSGEQEVVKYLEKINGEWKIVARF